MAEINSPYVIKVVGYILDEPKSMFYLVSEYCSGGNLGEIIAVK